MVGVNMSHYIGGQYSGNYFGSYWNTAPFIIGHWKKDSLTLVVSEKVSIVEGPP